MGQVAKKVDEEFSALDVHLERDGFCRNIIRELSGLLEEMVGLDEASGFISVVGQNIGNDINNEYKQLLNTDILSKDQITRTLVDLKARIQGGFYIMEQTNDRIVLGNTVCPFGDKVKGRPSLCMMTSNVFGTIAAENNGYAKINLDETIANGCDECRVTVYLDNNAETQAAEGREYFKDE